MFHYSRLTSREEVAHETLAIRIDRPDGFEFQAGAYVDLTILGLQERDYLGPIRSLSISSAPQAPYLEFLVRIRETVFKRALATYPLGTEVELEGPLDNLKLDLAAERKLVFLAGGVGIAPFLSALRGTALARRGLRAALFYSNRRPEDAVALEELTRYQDEIPGFRFIPTMTRSRESAPPWSGETGRISTSLLEEHLTSLQDTTYHIAGSPTFISELRTVLIDLGVEYDAIRIELFTGY